MVKEAPAVESPVSARQAMRYGFIDMLRGIALVFMIETHVVVAYLAPALRQNWFYYWLSFFNGLVAPAFLFASGFSVMLQARSQWEAWLGLRAPFWKRLKRLGFILLVGYALHIEHWSLSRYLSSADLQLWRQTLQVDILHCIVASLLIAHLLIFLTRKREIFAYGAVAAGAVACLATPWIWALDFTGRMPLALALYLNPHGVSLFPLFPWIGFVLAGVVAAILFLKAVERGADVRFMLRLLLAGMALLVAGLLGSLLPFSLPGYSDFFLTSPLYVMIRLGCVLLFSVLLFLLEKFLRFVPRAIETAGRESLLVYGAHLLAIFSLMRGKVLGDVLGREAGYLGCLLMSLALIFSMLWLARQWQELKRDYPKAIQWSRAVVVLLLLLLFVLR